MRAASPCLDPTLSTPTSRLGCREVLGLEWERGGFDQKRRAALATERGHVCPVTNPCPCLLPPLRFCQEFKQLAEDMLLKRPLPDSQPAPPNQLAKQWSLVPPVVTDTGGWGAPGGVQGNACS